jgi:hypothetical protein
MDHPHEAVALTPLIADKFRYRKRKMTETTEMRHGRHPGLFEVSKEFGGLRRVAAMNSPTILARELAEMFGLSEAQVYELGHREGLPFSVSGAYGLFVHRLDLTAWQKAALAECETEDLRHD